MRFKASRFFGGATAGVLLGLVAYYLWSMYPRTGLAILIDETAARIQSGQTYEQVVAILGPEQGRLSDELILKNLNRRYVSIDPAKDFKIPNEVGGENLIWTNEDDGRAWLIVSFGRDRKVRKSYHVEITYFIE